MAGVWTKGTQRISRTPFSSLRDAAHGKLAGRETNGVSRKRKVKQHNQMVCGLDGKRRKGEMGRQEKRVENREISLGYPGFVRSVFTKYSKPLGKIGKDH
ncbi:hypothetical protein TNCV_5102421 [Trichonephila clavipes]|nr:hypothetical protein TNCV_5102421 [Trichonephila clavipes]